MDYLIEKAEPLVSRAEERTFTEKKTGQRNSPRLTPGYALDKQDSDFVRILANNK